MAGGGIVHLVGAGPGDPGLMTVRALELIAQADAILYDRLIPPAALDGARPGCDLRYVGKQPGDAAMSQEQINSLLIELAAGGRRVVRLKGGDPFVFGRGGEEAEALAREGLAFEVVPGVTAGIAAPAYAGVPVTHRDTASAVAFVTGHENPEKNSKNSASVPNPSQTSKDSASVRNPSRSSKDSQLESTLDWEALARFPGTLVFYMGIKNLPTIARRLTDAGRSGAEAAAVIERGTLPDQRTVLGTLADIASKVEQERIRPPAITVVGPVARLRERIAWRELRPLHGRRVAVTRARAQASGFASRLRALGAEVVEAPVIRIVPRAIEGELAGMIGAIDRYAVLCLTSPNGATLLFDALRATGRDARALAGVTVAAIGPGTAAELARHGIVADVVPERSVAEALVEALESVPVEGREVLVARAAQARDLLPEALSARGAEVHVAALYDTVAEPLSDEARAGLERSDYVTFTSSSTVTMLLEALGTTDGLPQGARVVSIGPITSATAREHGLTVHVEAGRHDIDGLVAALVGDAG